MSENALDLMAALVLESGHRWGEVAAPFQWEDAKAVLDSDGPPFHFLTRARGGSKTGDLAGLALAAMLAQLPPGSRLYGLAADRDQGRLLLDSIEGYIARTPELHGALEVSAYRVVAPRTFSVLEVLAADAAGAWGLRPDFLIVDEIAQWAETREAKTLWEAASTAAAKLPNARMVVLTTAGDPAHWSRKLLEHATEDKLWRVHEVEGAAPWTDPDRLDEQRRRLPESSFRRLFLNEWTAPEDRLVAPDDLDAAAILDGPLPPSNRHRYVIALDIGLKRDRTVAAVCHAEALLDDEHRQTGSHVFLDRMEVWSGSRAAAVQLSDVEEWVAEASRAYNNAFVIADPWQATGLVQRLRTRGVWIEERPFSAQSNGRLANTLHQLLRNRQIFIPDDPDLLDELARVRLRETSPGVLRLDHDPDRHDDRAIALALAAHELTATAVTGPSTPPMFLSGPRHELDIALGGGGLRDLIDHSNGEAYL